MHFNTEPGPGDEEDEEDCPYRSYDLDVPLARLSLKEVYPGDIVQITIGRAINEQRQFDIAVTTAEDGVIKGAISTFQGNTTKPPWRNFELHGSWHPIVAPEGSSELVQIAEQLGVLEEGEFIYGKVKVPDDVLDDGSDQVTEALRKALFSGTITSIYVPDNWG